MNCIYGQCKYIPKCEGKCMGSRRRDFHEFRRVENGRVDFVMPALTDRIKPIAADLSQEQPAYGPAYDIVG